jgi:hypothetical protein
MIVEDERDTFLSYTYDNHASAVITPVGVTREGRISFSEFLEKFSLMKNEVTHHQLRNNLIKHQWEIKGSEVGEDD